MTTLEELDAQIRTLKEQVKQLRQINRQKRQPLVKRHIRKLRCINCGVIGTREEMEQVSRYEYQHIICVTERIPRTIRIEFN